MEKIISSHIAKGNIIKSGAATCYSWLDEINSGYTHHAHNNWHGDFGENIDSTSYKEQLWHNLKFYIKKINHLIPSNNLVLFLRENDESIKVLLCPCLSCPVLKNSKVGTL